MECAICFIKTNLDKDVKCDAITSHAFCQECMNNLIQTNLKVNHDATVNCLSIGGDCNGKIILRSVLNSVSTELRTQLLEDYILLQQKSTQVETNKTECNLKDIMNLLNLHCPNCKLPFSEFDGCLAIRCSTIYGCGGHFCAICFDFYGENNTLAHQKIMHDHHVLFLNKQEYLPHQQLYRAKQIRKYLDHMQFQGNLQEFFQPIQQHLEDVITLPFYQAIINNNLPIKLLLQDNPAPTILPLQRNPFSTRGKTLPIGWPVPIAKKRKPITPVATADLFHTTINRLHTLDLVSLQTLTLFTAYLGHLQMHIPRLLQRRCTHFNEKIIQWCQNGMSEQLIFLFQQEIVANMSPETLQHYIGHEDNYDDTLFTIFRTDDREYISRIFAPLENGY